VFSNEIFKSIADIKINIAAGNLGEDDDSERRFCCFYAFWFFGN
jgi:hypothetical protein